MKIQKFLHSCIALEEQGSRILIDPGEFSLIEKKIALEQLPASDIILLTHEHSDHYFAPVIKALLEKKQGRILTNMSVSRLLKNEGIASDIVAEGSSASIPPFLISGVRAPHGEIPTLAPENIGFLINSKVFHPGDSLAFDLPLSPDVLLLPISAPWLTLAHALRAAIRVRPKIVVPIHDAIIKDFMLERMYKIAENMLKPEGIVFRPLALGETLET